MNQIEEYMRAAIEEQNKCDSYPKIGAVIVKDGKIVATGFRNEVKGKHAERVAMEKIPLDMLNSAHLFTTLEPCVEIHAAQPEKSCTELICENKVSKVTIGVLDPNGRIYCQGYSILAENNIEVDFFSPELREIIEGNTFKYGDCNIGFGPTGKRRVAVLGSGKNFEIRYSRTGSESITFKWQTLQFSHGIVDLVSKTGNDSIRDATGINSFDKITDPFVFRETSHFSRMKTGDIAIIAPSGNSFVLLIKLLEMTPSDIYFQWQVRDRK